VSTPAPEVHPRRGLVVAAVVLVLVVIGTGAAQLLSQVATGTVEQTSTLVPAADRFMVDSDAGDVALAPSADGNVHVRTVVRFGLGQPELIEESTPSGVRLDVHCNALLATRCDVSYLVELPPSFEVIIGGTAGDVSAHGLTGPIRVDRSTGDVALFDVTGPVDATSTTGEITATRLRSDMVRAETRSGDVRLELLATPRTVQVDATSGEVDIAVPSGTGYRVSARTRSGDESVTVPVDPAADRSITVNGGSGDIRIHATP
jgi:hypothetical protein